MGAGGKIICTLPSLPPQESESQRGCVWTAGEATKSRGEYFGQGGEMRLLVLTVELWKKNKDA